MFPLTDWLRLLYPQGCAVCGAPGAAALCDACRAKIPIRPAEACCAICGKTLIERDAALGTAAHVCRVCREEPPPFDLARSAALLQGPVRTLVHDLKYHHAEWLAPVLGELLHGCFLAHYAAERPDVVVPIPLHPFKRLSRGYNQSELLARDLARRLGLPCAPRLVARVRNTATQTKRDRAERRRNMDGAFAVRPARVPFCAGKRVLLVDDVMTTGATFAAAARALRDAGAARVLCLSVARD
jgi:ComF family protein